MNRQTAIEKWDDSWFVAMPPDWKCAWQYLCDKCDHAGVWDPMFDLATIQICGKGVLDWDKFRLRCGTRIEVIDDGRWWLTGFISFQINGRLYPKYPSKSPWHEMIVKTLVKRGLLEKYAGMERKWFGETQLRAEAAAIAEVKPEEQWFLKIDDKDRTVIAREIIAHLNTKADRNFDARSFAHVKLVISALAEVHDDAAGIKTMIDRAVALTKGTKWEEYLQPSTLFAPEKFRERYDKRNLPVTNKPSSAPASHEGGFFKK